MSKYEHPFVEMLQGIELLRADKDFATRVYESMCNLSWRQGSATIPQRGFSVSWRGAAAIVAEIRGEMEGDPLGYCNFYCSGNEGTIHADVEALFNHLGWFVCSMELATKLEDWFFQSLSEEELEDRRREVAEETEAEMTEFIAHIKGLSDERKTEVEDV